MQFKGQLLLPSEGGPGLPVNLEVVGHHLALVSEQEELGAWPLEAIKARRLRGDTFAITVAGEDLHFIADDTISFAYVGMPAIERFAGRYRNRSPLRALRDWFGQDASKPRHEPEVTPPSPPAKTDKSVPSREDKSPRHQIPTGTEPQSHRPQAPQQVPDPQPEFPSPAPHGGARPPSPTEDESSDRSEPERPAPPPNQRPNVETMTPQQVIDTQPETVPAPQDEPTASPTDPRDPERAFAQGFQQAQEARARLIRKGTAQLTRVYSQLDEAFTEVERGDLDPHKAMAMAQLARTMCAILELDEEPAADADEDSPPLPPI